MEQKGRTKELHRPAQNEVEILAELFRYGVANNERAIKDSTPNIVTAMSNILHMSPSGHIFASAKST